MPEEKLYWTNIKGEKIDIDTMSEEYLRNVLKMIIRYDNKKRRNFIEKEFNNILNKSIHNFERQENEWREFQ